MGNCFTDAMERRKDRLENVKLFKSNAQSDKAAQAVTDRLKELDTMHLQLQSQLMGYIGNMVTTMQERGEPDSVTHVLAASTLSEIARVAGEISSQLEELERIKNLRMKAGHLLSITKALRYRTKASKYAATIGKDESTIEDQSDTYEDATIVMDSILELAAPPKPMTITPVIDHAVEIKRLVDIRLKSIRESPLTAPLPSSSSSSDRYEAEAKYLSTAIPDVPSRTNRSTPPPPPPPMVIPHKQDPLSRHWMQRSAYSPLVTVS